MLSRKCSSGFRLHCRRVEKYFLLLSTLQTYLGLPVNVLYFSPILTTFGVSIQISITVLGIKFHDNPSSGGRSDAWKQKNRQKEKHTDGRTDVKKLIVSLRLYANVPKNGHNIVPNSQPVPLAKLLTMVWNSWPWVRYFVQCTHANGQLCLCAVHTKHRSTNTVIAVVRVAAIHWTRLAGCIILGMFCSCENWLCIEGRGYYVFKWAIPFVLDIITSKDK